MRRCAEGIATAESPGGVASEILERLSVLGGGGSPPINRPLLGFDGVEAERMVRKIGTFEPPINPSMSLGPYLQVLATKARLDEVAKIEEDLKSSADL